MNIPNVKSHSQGKNLDEWLCYIESIHNTEIDLGLTRIAQVAKRLAIDFSFAKVITVAGTNGKGTTCAFIENALLSQSASVAVYSSPHILQFNERLRVNKQDVADSFFIECFERVEQARADISLSYYEFTTLASLLILMAKRPEYIILEVGLGGRLDATNIINADVAVITTIDLDHQAFLGDTREAIGYEKAGIMRGNKTAVIGDCSPPASLEKHANAIGANAVYRNQDFKVESGDGIWQWQNSHYHLSQLMPCFIPQDNVATALEVLSQLSIPLNEPSVNQWIKETKVAGRTELFKTTTQVMLDVGHNPQAARYLAAHIKQKKVAKVYAVVAMLQDKDIKNTLLPFKDIMDQWLLADLDVHRGAKSSALANYLVPEQCCVQHFDSVENAYEKALSLASEDDLVLVFGSFYTVAKIRPLLLS